MSPHVSLLSAASVPEESDNRDLQIPDTLPKGVKSWRVLAQDMSRSARLARRERDLAEHRLQQAEQEYKRTLDLIVQQRDALRSAAGTFKATIHLLTDVSFPG